MKHPLTALTLTIALLTAGAGTAQAHERTFRSTVEGVLAAREEGTNNVSVVGQVRSPRPQCVPDRRVKVFAVMSDGSKELKDITRTSDRGYFGTYDDFTGARNALMRVVPKNIGRGRHRHICGGDSDTFEEAPAPTPAQP